MSLSVLGEERLWPAQQLHATEIPAFVELLVKSSDRWSNVEFAHLSQAVACGLAEIHTPMLESIKITAEVSVLHQLDIFRAPSLRALALHTQGPGRLDEFVLDLPLFWDRLTHINLDSTGPESPSQGLCLYNVFVLLGRCPQLISFAFRANTSRDHFDSISGHVSLPFLKTFVLFEPAILEPFSIHRLMQHLSMPELRQLHVPTVSNRAEPCPNFLATIGVSSPLIEILLINLPSFTEHSIFDALTGLPSLTKLTVLNIAGWTWGQAVEADFSHPEHLLALLTPGSVVVCSRLQDLRVRDCISLSKNVLVEFIQKRIDLTPGFRRFDIVFTRPCGTDMSEDEIQSYTSRGLHLSLSVSDDDSWGFTPSEFTPWTGLSTFNWSESF